MKEGQQVLFLRDDQPPLKSDLTHLVAAAVICGFEFANNKPLLDTLEEVDGQPKRSVTWSLDGASKATFRPQFTEATFDLAEFRKCFEDLEWCRANPDHPIAYLRAFSDALSSLRNELRAQKPLFLVRRGKRFALIPQDADPAKKAELLAML
jgi:hypothetical protein